MIEINDDEYGDMVGQGRKMVMVFDNKKVV